MVQEESSARIAGLEIWFGRVDPVPLAGGITNKNFTVDDQARRAGGEGAAWPVVAGRRAAEF